MHLQPALHWCVYPKGPDTTLLPLQTHWFWWSRWDLWRLPGAITCSQQGLPQRHSWLCSQIPPLGFSTEFSNYREEEGKKEEAIPNPAIKLQRFPGSCSTPLKGCDGRFMLHQPFPAQLLPAQSALRKPHHRGVPNLGQLLEAPGGNKCSLPPSVPALARVCTDIIFSLYPLIWWGFPSTTLHPRNTPTHHFLDVFPNSLQAPSSRRADIFSGWNAKENSHGTTCLAAGISSEQNQGVLQICCNCPEKGFSKATVVRVLLPHCTH